MKAKSTDRSPRRKPVADGIRDMILRGDFKSGDRLTEAGLCELLKVSRTPIREALARLADERLLVHSFAQGYSVRTFTPDEILGAFRIRELLDGLAGRMAAEHGLSADHVAEFEKCLQDMEKLNDGGSIAPNARALWPDLSLRFHELLVEAAANETLKWSLSRATNLPYLLPNRHYPHEPDDALTIEDMTAACEQHRAILNALRERDADTAEREARARAREACETFKRIFLVPARMIWSFRE